MASPFDIAGRQQIEGRFLESTRVRQHPAAVGDPANHVGLDQGLRVGSLKVNPAVVRRPGAEFRVTANKVLPCIAGNSPAFNVGLLHLEISDGCDSLLGAGVLRIGD